MPCTQACGETGLGQLRVQVVPASGACVIPQCRLQNSDGMAVLSSTGTSIKMNQQAMRCGARNQRECPPPVCLPADPILPTLSLCSPRSKKSWATVVPRGCGADRAYAPNVQSPAAQGWKEGGRTARRRGHGMGCASSRGQPRSVVAQTERDRSRPRQHAECRRARPRNETKQRCLEQLGSAARQSSVPGPTWSS